MTTVESTRPAGHSTFINRELSWLAFNERVLAQAEDETIPLLERLKFCAIYASNLDEFFQVRVAGLKEQVAAGISKAPPDGLSPLAQLAAIRDEVRLQADRLEQIHLGRLRTALAEEGIAVLDYDDLEVDEVKAAKAEFENRIFSVLTPLAVDPSHPFPYISNLSLSLAVLVDDPDVESLRFARLKVPPSLPRFIELSPNRFIPVEQVIVAHLDQLFPGMRVVGGWPFRVTRNADMTLDDEDADDLLEAIEMELRRRRFGRAIRLELDRSMPLEAQELLIRELDLDQDDVYPGHGPLDLTGYWQLMNLDRSDLKYEPSPSVTPRRLRDLEDSRDFFARLQRADIVVHHPYDSFSASVAEFIRQASLDRDVLAIKMTLYRTSGDSPIIDALIRAAEQGKQVAALVELKARFDEEANITWARRLEEAGVHVVYGLVGLKIHTKTALVVRDEPDGVRRYCHIGTGNYNHRTARIYEDIGILTADPAVGADLTQLFNFLTGYGREVQYDRLLVAPHSLRQPLEELIAAEMDAPAGTGRIIMKMNSLVDASVIERLYTASQAGVKIDLIVRGICCLRAGVEGLSENIRVRSLVGRYLEHSRIYHFANGGGFGRPQYFIGSADLMPRNLDRRVEVVIRVDHEPTKERLQEVLAVNLEDSALAWEQHSDGSYHRLRGATNAHNEFELLARERVVHTDPTVREAPELRRPPEFPAPSLSGSDVADTETPVTHGALGAPVEAPSPAQANAAPETTPPPVSEEHPHDGANAAGSGSVVVGEPTSEAQASAADHTGEESESTGAAESSDALTREEPASGGAPESGPTAVVDAEPVSEEEAATGEPIAAAGCVLYRLGADGVEVLVAHRPHYDDWSFPKGKREADESDLDCAKRELFEETGFKGRVEEELQAAHYPVRGRPKTVRYWLMQLLEGQFRPNDEVDAIRWVSPNVAESVLSYEHDRQLLASVPPDPSS